MKECKKKSNSFIYILLDTVVTHVILPNRGGQREFRMRISVTSFGLIKGMIGN